MMNEKYKIAYELCKQDIELGLCKLADYLPF